MKYEVTIEWTAKAVYRVDTQDEKEAINLAHSDTIEPTEYDQTVPRVICKALSRE